MKTIVLFKVFLVVPLILLADYVIMVLLGCSGCLFGFGENFNCTGYCLFGKIILAISFLLCVYLFYPELKNVFKKNKDVQTISKPKDM